MEKESHPLDLHQPLFGFQPKIPEAHFLFTGFEPWGCVSSPVGRSHGVFQLTSAQIFGHGLLASGVSAREGKAERTPMKQKDAKQS